MAIRITRGMLQRILAHAAEEPEREVCGLLLASRPFAPSLAKPVLSNAAGGVEGGCPPSSTRQEGRTGLRQAQPERVEAVAETANVCSDPADSFEVDPTILFAILRAERAGGPRVIGHYHSHPNGSPTPSARDAAMALQPGRLWLIVAAGEARMWREVPGGAMHGAFDPVELVVEHSDGGCT
jgi:proteasome lid subunit RPN8/RPN11